MPVNFKNPDLKAMSGQTADKDYFLDKDGNIAQDEASAATLLIRQGQEMSKEQAEQIGSQSTSSQPEDAEGEKSDSAPKANKSAAPTAAKKGAK